MLLEGLQLPLTTPFYPDGRLNLLKLEHNVARYSKTPIAGMVTLSDCGEPMLLSDEEKRLTLRTVANAAAVEKVLLAGVSHDSVRGTLELAEFAANAGYDAVLVKAPSFSGKGGQRDAKALMTYFQAVADRSALPVVIQSSASSLSGSLPVEIIVESADHPRIIGLVDDMGEQERIEMIFTGAAGVKHDVTVTSVFAAVTARMLSRNEGLIAADSLTGGGAAVAVASAKVAAKTRAKVVGFQVLVGKTAAMLGGLKAGAVGAMPAFAASAPQACYEVLAAWKDGDEGLAQEKQARLQDAAAMVEGALGVAGIKFGCDLNGYFGGGSRLPVLPLTGEERAEVEALMQGLRN